MEQMDWGIWALGPLALTLILAFVTRSALVAMLAGAFVGTLMLGAAPGAGLNQLFQESLGNGDFIWICQIVVLIGILFELFKRSGVLGELARRFSGAKGSRRQVELTTWGMGFAIVDDYFSPLLTGAVMRSFPGKNWPSFSTRQHRLFVSWFRTRPGAPTWPVLSLRREGGLPLQRKVLQFSSVRFPTTSIQYS